MFLLLSYPVGASAETVNINGDNVTGKVTNLDFRYVDADADFWITFDGVIAPWLPIPKPVLHFDVKLTLGTKADFDLNIRSGRLPAGLTADSDITLMTPGMDVFLLKDNLMNHIPAIGAGAKMAANLLVGVTKPAAVKGTFDNQWLIVLSIDDGVKFELNPNVEFTSVIPANKEEETTVCVGTQYVGGIELGVVEVLDFKLGPVVSITANAALSGKATATLHKDEWAGDLPTLPDAINDLHTCTENGKDGCVSGWTRNAYELSGIVKAKVTVPVIDYDLINATWEFASTYKNTGSKAFVQSLTWKEKLKYQETCDHHCYKVPVRVWLDQDKTKPVRGIYVHKDGVISGDSTCRRYAFATTGQNEDLIHIYGDVAEGRANIYLPYTDGKYTIIADTYGSEDPEYRSMTGKAEMPTNMRRGANDPVDIILESRETRDLTVEKKWDIDFEEKDRPEKIDVLLQAQYYNTGFFRWEAVKKDGVVQTATLSDTNFWSHTFTGLPRYEIDDKGKAREIKYRIRELKASDIPVEDMDGALFPEDIGNIIDQADAYFRPDDNEFSKRIVPAKYDFDNVHVWEVLKNKVTDFNTLWEIDASISYLSTLGKESLFPDPTVVYKVEEYTTITGDTVAAHSTKYQVNYEEKNNTTTITNTALLDTAIYKRWLMFGDNAEIPDEVWLLLEYRIDEKYREYVTGDVAEKVVGLWLPVWQPISGDIASIGNIIASITDVDFLKYLDYLITLDTKLTKWFRFGLARVQKPEEGIHNPLKDWRAKFRVKKYGFMGIPGIPVEFQAAEVTSAILQDVLKFLTGLDIPISASFNPFSGQLYVTIPGKMYQIPVIDKDWERTSNVINTWIDPNFPDTTVIGGNKVWQGDKEEDRPDKLTIVVKEKVGNGDDAHEEEVGRTTITKADNEGMNPWAWSLRSTDVREGKTLNPNRDYIISEEFPADYAYKNRYMLTVNGRDLINTWIDPTKPPEIVIRKVLQQTEEHDPLSFHIKLYDGETELYDWTTKSMTKDDEDETTFYPTPAQIAGKDVSKFRIEEVDKSSDYDVTYEGPVLSTKEDGTPVYTFTVTNTWNQSLVYIAQKIWEDDNEEVRPKQIRVQPWMDFTLILKEENNWQAAFDPYPPKPDAFDIQVDGGKRYRLFEVKDADYPIPDTYRVTNRQVGVGDKYYFQLINRYVGETVTVKGKKTWNDGGAIDGRPEKLRITLLDNVNGAVATADTNAASLWEWEFKDLPRYDSRTKEPLQYFVTEGTVSNQYGDEVVTPGVEGYTAVMHDPVWDEDAKTWTCDITNSRNMVNVHVVKVWDDGDDALGIRPDKVTVRLIEKESSAELDSMELSDDNNWHGVFEGLPVLPENEGYIIEEDPVDGYTTTVKQAGADGDTAETEPSGADGDTAETEPGGADGVIYYTITNTLDDSLIKIRVKKVWEGDGAYPDARPERVTFRLMNGDKEVKTLSLSKEDNWEGFFESVPKQDGAGQAIEYTVTEDPIGGYDAPDITGNAQDGFTVTNRFTNRRTIRVRKIWYDDDSGEHERPLAITIWLYANGVQKANGYISRGEDETEFVDYPVFDENGEVIQYTVREVSPPPAYNASVTGNMDDGFVITNTYVGNNYLDIEVTKTWVDDAAAAAPAHPDTITIRLYANGTEVDSREILEAEDGSWSCVFENKPVRYLGSDDPVRYTITEDFVPDYATDVSSEVKENGDIHFTVTNTATDGNTRSVTVRKVWEGELGYASSYPKSIRIHLYANGGEIAHQDMSEAEDGSWTCTFEPLPVRYLGSDDLIAYTISEEPVPGYTTRIEGDMDTGFLLTNTRDVLESIFVNKIWDDRNDIEGKRPSDISEDLYVLKNGERMEVLANRVDGSENVYELKPLLGGRFPLYEDGQKVEYGVGEERVPGYEEPIIQGDAESGFVITNRLIWTLTDITVRKQWIDNSAEHPQSISATLLSDEEEAGEFQPVESFVLNAENHWEHTVEGLRIHDDRGRKIEYEVREEIPPGYGPPFITRDGDGFLIQNWKAPKAVALIQKIWEGDEGEARPSAVGFRLMDGERVVQAFQLTAAEDWKKQIADLPRTDEQGRQITYSLIEEEAEGYDSAIEAAVDETGSVYTFKATNIRKTAPYTVEFYYQEDGAYPDAPNVSDSRTAPTGTEVSVTEADLVPPDGKYVLDENAANVLRGMVTEDGKLVLKLYFKRVYTIIFDANGGTIRGTTEEKTASTYDYGEVITILAEPVRPGYEFLYWEGSQYYPGELYTVREDHTFVAQWEKEPGYDYKFTFTKRWVGAHENSLEFALYDQNGAELDKPRRRIISDTEWRYEKWFVSDQGYYVIETVPAGYKVRYENVGRYADVTDRCYNDGTIINYKIPKTGDRTASPAVLAGCALAGTAGIVCLLSGRRRRRRRP